MNLKSSNLKFRYLAYDPRSNGLQIKALKQLVCVCVYFLLTEQNNGCNVRVQVSDIMLRKLLCVTS